MANIFCQHCPINKQSHEMGDLPLYTTEYWERKDFHSLWTINRTIHLYYGCQCRRRKMTDGCHILCKYWHNFGILKEISLRIEHRLTRNKINILYLYLKKSLCAWLIDSTHSLSCNSLRPEIWKGHSFVEMAMLLVTVNMSEAYSIFFF